MSMRTPGEPRRAGLRWLWRLAPVAALFATMAVVLSLPFAAVALVMPAALGLLVVSLVGMFGGGHRPASFVVSGREFVAPARWWVPALATGWVVFASAQVGRILRPRRGGAWADRLYLEDVVFLGFLAVCLVLLVVLASRRRSVALRPEGVVRWAPTGRVVIPWEAVGQGRGVVVNHYLARWLHLAVVPGGARRRGLVPFIDELPLQELDVDGRFLADAIEFYVRHPERRAAIGSAEEHRRLFADLAEWYAANRPVAPPVG
ncbi:MAG: hypothetical protein HOU81_24595 [Hamadaea sp.]|uniref:hypothetical protein n=1 Tax=Hamadaea sp. TaxID=2024425 RepID=UPI0017FF9313|nr:hypothetical protein [Hamadaea sp.]NUR74005.1 hypothetical protein [Hamadaea sp.]NUT21196.1 hypothetical protein [Hamadaea sp.]